MNLIASLPHTEVTYKFISSHYDIHLSGLCIYDGAVCEFKADFPTFNKEADEYDIPEVKIYSLTWIEKRKWLWKQWLFELCVGNHYSYVNGKRCGEFRIRKPEWLHHFLFGLYYKL